MSAQTGLKLPICRYTDRREIQYYICSRKSSKSFRNTWVILDCSQRSKALHGYLCSSCCTFYRSTAIAEADWSQSCCCWVIYLFVSFFGACATYSMVCLSWLVFNLPERLARVKKFGFAYDIFLMATALYPKYGFRWLTASRLSSKERSLTSSNNRWVKNIFSFWNFVFLTFSAKVMY